jgi:predicted NBD/HSP70 family sugar kinase
MGQAVSSLIGTLNVHRIVIAGELARFGRPLLDAIRETIAQTTLARLAGETRVEFEHLGHHEIILGASALILRDYSLLFRSSAAATSRSSSGARRPGRARAVPDS